MRNDVKWLRVVQYIRIEHFFTLKCFQIRQPLSYEGQHLSFASSSMWFQIQPMGLQAILCTLEEKKISCEVLKKHCGTVKPVPTPQLIFQGRFANWTNTLTTMKDVNFNFDESRIF